MGDVSSGKGHVNWDAAAGGSTLDGGGRRIDIVGSFGACSNSHGE